MERIIPGNEPPRNPFRKNRKEPEEFFQARFCMNVGSIQETGRTGRLPPLLYNFSLFFSLSYVG